MVLTPWWSDMRLPPLLTEAGKGVNLGRCLINVFHGCNQFGPKQTSLPVTFQVNDWTALLRQRCIIQRLSGRGSCRHTAVSCVSDVEPYRVQLAQSRSSSHAPHFELD